eukprot:15476707-Alexandrium_andersonii.AAC.1
MVVLVLHPVMALVTRVLVDVQVAVVLFEPWSDKLSVVAHCISWGPLWDWCTLRIVQGLVFGGAADM